MESFIWEILKVVLIISGILFWALIALIRYGMWLAKGEPKYFESESDLYKYYNQNRKMSFFNKN